MLRTAHPLLSYDGVIRGVQEMEADGLTPGETHYSYAVFACAVGRRPGMPTVSFVLLPEHVIILSLC